MKKLTKKICSFEQRAISDLRSLNNLLSAQQQELHTKLENCKATNKEQASRMGELTQVIIRANGLGVQAPSIASGSKSVAVDENGYADFKLKWPLIPGGFGLLMKRPFYISQLKDMDLGLSLNIKPSHHEISGNQLNFIRIDDLLGVLAFEIRALETAMALLRGTVNFLVSIGEITRRDFIYCWIADHTPSTGSNHKRSGNEIALLKGVMTVLGFIESEEHMYAKVDTVVNMPYGTIPITKRAV